MYTPPRYDRRELSLESPALEWELPGWTWANWSQTIEMRWTPVVFVPIVVVRPSTFDRVSIYVTTEEASTVVRFGMYEWEGGLPGALIQDYGTVDSDTTGMKTLTISQTLSRGWYWLCVAYPPDSVGDVSVKTGSAESIVPPLSGRSSEPLGNTMAASVGFYVSADYSAGLPDPAPTLDGQVTVDYCVTARLRRSA